LCLVTASGVAAAKDSSLPSKPPVQRESAPVRLDVTGGRWSFHGGGTPFTEVAKLVEAKVPVEIRIQDATLGAVTMNIGFEAQDTDKAMQLLLGGFNYSKFADPKSGRNVYLVTSLTSETKRPAAEMARAAAAPVAAPSAAVGGTQSSRPEHIEDFRKVAPARILSREQPQEEIDRDVQRERDEKLMRAVDALASADTTSVVQRDAMADLARSGDSRATPALRAAMSQVAGLPGDAAPQVARSVWQHAAQLQFADADANALLLSLGSSANARVREVGQAARRDMDRYRAAQNAQPGR